MTPGHAFHLPLEAGAQPLRKDRCPVTLPLRVTHEDDPVSEVDVLHAQAETLEEAQAAAVEQGGHQTVSPPHLPEQRPDLVSGEYRRETLRPLRTMEAEIRDRLPENLAYAFNESRRDRVIARCYL